MTSAPGRDQAGYFRTRFPYDARRAAVWRHLTRYLARYVPADGRVLELGAGYCFFINEVQAKRRVAVDVFDDLSTHAAAGVEAVRAEATEYLAEVSPGEFDVIFASNFFEHFEWPALDRLIGLAIAALAPGGRLMVLQPNFRLHPGRYFDDFTHRAIFTDVSLRDWLESVGLRVIVAEPRFLPLSVKSRLGGLAWLVPLYLRLPWKPFAGQMLVVAERPRPNALPSAAV